MTSTHRLRACSRRGLRAVIAAAVLLGTVLPVASAREAPRSPTDTEQARSAVLGQRPRTTAAPATPDAPRNDPKLDTPLAGLAASTDDRGGMRAAVGAGLRVVDDRVETTVEVTHGSAEAVSAAIVHAGGKPGYVADHGLLIEALLPKQALRAVAARADVLRIRVPDVAYEAGSPRMGTLVTQGDAALNGPAWRAAGWYGTGVKIGIIDIGFQGYPDVLDDELPASVTVKNFVDGETDGLVNGRTKHGVACAEVIHDIAPGAQLFLAKIRTSVDLEEAADWLVDVQGVDIISSSLGFYNVTRGDGTGFFESVIAEKRAHGALWFTAASNDRQAHWGGSFKDTDADRNHEFAIEAGSAQEIEYFGEGDGGAWQLPIGTTISVFIRWNDWTQPVDQDFDLYLWRYDSGPAVWTKVGESRNVQAGGLGQTPTESVSFTTTSEVPAPYGWSVKRVVRRDAIIQSVNFEMFAPKVKPLDEQVHARSLSNLADASSAVTIAAVDSGSPYAQEVYSSEGPANGPGGSASRGFSKPDFAAYANVDTKMYGTVSQFNGTSAATPHAAAAAALVLEANPTFTPTEIEGYLATSAVDLGATGSDSLFGHGRLRLGTPVANPDAPPLVSKPIAGFRAGQPGTADSRVAIGAFPIPVRVSWAASDPQGIGDVDLGFRLGTGGVFGDSPLPSPTATSATFYFSPGPPTGPTGYGQFRARATDNALHTSPWVTGAPFKVSAVQDEATLIHYTGTWTLESKTGPEKFYGGTVKYASTSSRRAVYTVAAKEIAFVTTFGSDRGRALIVIDGVSTITLDLYRAGAPATRQIAYRKLFRTSGDHTIEVRVLGTKNAASTGTRVDLDAFLTILP